MELHASYVYMSMAFHYERHDIALMGFAKLMKDQNQRGGRVCLAAIDAPGCQEWKGSLHGLEDALALEKKVNESLLALHKLAEKHSDPHLTDFLESEYLDEQVKSIKELADMITRLKRAGTTGLGEHIVDKELQS